MTMPGSESTNGGRDVDMEVVEAEQSSNKRKKSAESDTDRVSLRYQSSDALVLKFYSRRKRRRPSSLISHRRASASLLPRTPPKPRKALPRRRRRRKSSRRWPQKSC